MYALPIRVEGNLRYVHKIRHRNQKSLNKIKARGRVSKHIARLLADYYLLRGILHPFLLAAPRCKVVKARVA